MKALTVGSLFSGIGGLDLGFERAGFVIKWQVEIDPYCRKVLHKHWPAVPCYEDVRTVGAHNLEPVDVLVGGFPCQDISIAGKGAGIDGERSGLWREYARLIGELRPRYAVVENVPALVHRGLDRVLGELTDLGYDAEWQPLSAQAFGAPHIRRRLFIVAWNVADTESMGCRNGHAEYNRAPFGTCDASGNSRTILAYPAGDGRREGRAGRPAAQGQNGQIEQAVNLANTERDGLEKQGIFRIQGRAAVAIADAGWWAVEPNVGRVANGVPHRVDRLRGLGNAVVPQAAQYVAECVKAHAERCEA